MSLTPTELTVDRLSKSFPSRRLRNNGATSDYFRRLYDAISFKLRTYRRYSPPDSEEMPAGCPAIELDLHRLSVDI